jgi:hypothetical protein
MHHRKKPITVDGFTPFRESAGINRHVVRDGRALRERSERIHPGLESCMIHREVFREAQAELPVGRAIELRKGKDQDADSMAMRRKASRDFHRAMNGAPGLRRLRFRLEY